MREDHIAVETGGDSVTTPLDFRNPMGVAEPATAGQSELVAISDVDPGPGHRIQQLRFAVDALAEIAEVPAQRFPVVEDQGAQDSRLRTVSRLPQPARPRALPLVASDPAGGDCTLLA
jgi:hypothetical protein